MTPPPNPPLRSRRRGRLAVVGLLAVLLVATGCLADQVGPVVAGPADPAIPVIGCDRAADHLLLTGPTQLDAGCDYTGGIEITTSDVLLDCRGADVTAPATDPWPWGILVHADASVALHDVTIRNCVVSGFATDVMVRRDGAEGLDPVHQYDAPFADIVIEDSRVLDATRDGIYLEWGVTGVTIRRTEVARSAAVGIYLNPAATGNVIEHNQIHDNGFGDVRADGLPFELGGTTFRYLSTGREGIALDGAFGNVVTRNDIWGNSSGGVMIYRNCGEYSTVNRRWSGADDNQIVENAIWSEPVGVWIASRQDENQWFMACADPAYVDAPYRRVHLDHASGNVVARNLVKDVTTGVRVEDDGNRIEANTFVSSRSADRAVVIGTQQRTLVLGLPVSGTVVRANRSEIAGSAAPFIWAWGHQATTDEANTAEGQPVGLVEGPAPAIGPFLFVVRVWV